MNFSHGETVTRLRASSAQDEYGNVIRSWATPTSLSIPGCAVATGGTFEPSQDARNAVVSDFDILDPSNSDVTAVDRVSVRGLVCEIVGRPFAWRSPFTGWAPGTVIRCSVVEG